MNLAVLFFVAHSGHDEVLDQVGVQLFDDPDVDLGVGLVDERPLIDGH